MSSQVCTCFLFFFLSYCVPTSKFELEANGKFLCNNTLWLQTENSIKHYHEIFEDKKWTDGMYESFFFCTTAGLEQNECED